jgi:TRAP-type uncharacterized transport system substrate-binding protein
MTAPIRPLRRHRWRAWIVDAGPVAVGVLLLGVIALCVAAYRVLDPTPAKRIVMATGPEKGAYAEFAHRYARVLAANGVKVELRTTQGSVENVALLHDAASGVQVAFVQGGIGERRADDDGEPVLESLGSVAYEPLWVFYREDSARKKLAKGAGAELTQLTQLNGWRINIGAAGSGSAPLFRALAQANRLDGASITFTDKSTLFGVVDVVQGQVDALAMVSAAEAPLVQYLLQTPGIKLLDFAQADGYARRFPYLHTVLLPRGVIDLAADLPPHDVRLVAATASLVVRADLHPALQLLLLQAARQLHGEPGWFARGSEFPNASVDVFPLSAEADRYYRSGPPWLQRYLPYWLATFIDRMWIVLLPLAAAVVPLSRVLPPLVALRLRSRVFRWYANLRAIERELDAPAPDLTRLSAELEAIDQQTERIGLPLSFTNELYELRSHIELVRRRIRDRFKPGAAEPK